MSEAWKAYLIRLTESESRQMLETVIGSLMETGEVCYVTSDGCNGFEEAIIWDACGDSLLEEKT